MSYYGGFTEAVCIIISYLLLPASHDPQITLNNMSFNLEKHKEVIINNSLVISTNTAYNLHTYYLFIC